MPEDASSLYKLYLSIEKFLSDAPILFYILTTAAVLGWRKYAKHRALKKGTPFSRLQNKLERGYSLFKRAPELDLTRQAIMKLAHVVMGGVILVLGGVAVTALAFTIPLSVPGPESAPSTTRVVLGMVVMLGSLGIVSYLMTRTMNWIDESLNSLYALQFRDLKTFASSMIVLYSERLSAEEKKILLDRYQQVRAFQAIEHEHDVEEYLDVLR